MYIMQALVAHAFFDALCCAESVVPPQLTTSLRLAAAHSQVEPALVPATPKQVEEVQRQRLLRDVEHITSHGAPGYYHTAVQHFHTIAMHVH
jgi:hypothetical protein